jgi:hypothetical protein
MPEDFHSGANATCPSCGNVYEKRAHWQKLCLKCYLAKKGKTTHATQPPAAKPEPPIPSDMLKRLLFLAHPDKHRNSEAATVATQWLLNQRCTHG